MTAEKHSASADNRAIAQEALNTVSGAYCSEFWDSVYEVTASVDTIREIKGALEALHATEHDEEAFNLVLALFDLVALEVPLSILEIKPYPEAVNIFIGEFLDDTADLIYDYESEETDQPAWS